MTDFRLKMQEIAAKSEQRNHALQAHHVMTQRATSSIKEKIKSILQEISEEFAQGDKKLLVVASDSENSPGFSISYGEILPKFSVTTTIHDESFDLHITDGHWEQIQGTLGSWADWTDDKIVYSGGPDTTAIRHSLETPFLEWYQFATQKPNYPIQ